jgi:transcriptional regulator with XRE-family HTH domain
MGTPSLSSVFGAVLREYREAEGLSQETLADKAGVHRTYVGLVERGQRNPTLEVGLRLATALGLTLTALIEAAERRFHHA